MRLAWVPLAVVAVVLLAPFAQGSEGDSSLGLAGAAIPKGRGARISPARHASPSGVPTLGGLTIRQWRRSANRHARIVRTQRRVLTGTHPRVDGCLRSLIGYESKWNHRATNPTTGAYGLPQALPGRKMASAGKDWVDNPETQIRWMLRYVNGRYGGSCSALTSFYEKGWY